jgi:tetratricopeptide (TPR) repeat protein
VPAYVNYSNFLLKEGRAKEALGILHKAMKKVPNTAILHHSLGLYYIQMKDKKNGLIELEKAMLLDKNDARFSYVYAVALSEKSTKEAIIILEKSHAKHSGNTEIISALIYYYKILGNDAKSSLYKKKLSDMQNLHLDKI